MLVVRVVEMDLVEKSRLESEQRTMLVQLLVSYLDDDHRSRRLFC